MKNVLVIIVLMICSSQLFAQETEKRMHKPYKMKAFVYKTDYLLDDAEVCKYLKTESIVIAKGNYNFDYSDNELGDITLKLAKPISSKGISIEGKMLSGIRCDNTCKEEGTYCFTCKTTSTSKATDILPTYLLKPIIENGSCIAIQLQYKGSGSPKNLGF